MSARSGGLSRCCFQRLAQVLQLVRSPGRSSAPDLGQRVGDPHRRPGFDLALDQAFLLELAQALGEQPVREPGNRLAELAEAHRPLGQGADDRPRPALADQLDRGMEVRADGAGAAGLDLGRRDRLH